MTTYDEDNSLNDRDDQDGPEEGNGSTPGVPRRIGPLDSIPSVRRELSSLYKAGRKQLIPSGDAYRLGQLLGLLARLLETSDLEKRLQDMEQRLLQMERREP